MLGTAAAEAPHPRILGAQAASLSVSAACRDRVIAALSQNHVCKKILPAGVPEIIS
jgi:hypothetical protein